MLTHRSVEEHLEEFLDGSLRGKELENFTSHTAACKQCHQMVSTVQEHVGIWDGLRAQDAVEPAPGFYSRVVRRIESQGRPGFWSVLLDPIFGRRLVYATASLVLLMGAFLMATEPERPELASTPVQVLAVSNPEHPPIAVSESGETSVEERDTVLVTLATFSDAE